MNFPMNKPKENAKSIAFRILGDSQFDEKTAEGFLKALKFYNKAICFAPNDSENLCIAYANRAAVYFNLYMFKECLENIDLVHKINKYPADLWENLRSQECICKTVIAAGDPNSDDVWIEPKLSFPPHEKVPFVANCLDVRKSKHFGNHIVANRDLRVGEIIGILDPFCTAQAERYKYERCENCCMENAQNLLPCLFCTAVMFCGENCMKAAMDGFHKYECLAIDLINYVIPQQLTKLTLRVVMCGLAIFQDIDKFLNTTEKGFKKNINTFSIDHHNKCDQYALIASLKKVTTTDMALVDAEVTCLLIICERILAASNIVSKKKPQEFKKTLTHILKQHFLMATINGRLFDDFSFHVANRRSPSYSDTENVDKSMSGLFPFIELMPHACIPNILCSDSTNRKIVSVVRPIKAGEQLFHSFA